MLLDAGKEGNESIRDKAVRRLADALDDENGTVRMSAIKLILSYTDGNPPSEVKVSSKGKGGMFEFVIRKTSNQDQEPLGESDPED